MKGGSKRGAVLLMGLCESGKTQMFAQICYGFSVTSVTSTTSSSAPYKMGNVSFMIFYSSLYWKICSDYRFVIKS